MHGSKDDPTDLCLHGDAAARIGDIWLCYNYATVSSTGLYLLKSLTEDHIIYEDNQMFPCCGFSFFPDESLQNVYICGCPNGVDWTILHKEKKICLIPDGGQEVAVSLEEYRKEVFNFADKVEAYYKRCSPKVFYDEEVKNAYHIFWQEWHRRRTE